jgi:uncharacterized protein
MGDAMQVREGLFQETAAGPVLLGNRCRSCGRTHFPSTPTCLDCLSAKMEDVELPQEGTLFSFTIMSMPSANFPAGHRVGYVTLLDDLRLFTPLHYEPGQMPKIGEKLKVELAPLWQGEGGVGVVGYRFTPIST